MAMMTNTATAAVTMPRRRTLQSSRSHRNTSPTGKKKIKNSTTVTVRLYQGSCIGDSALRLRDKTKVSSSSTHSGQPQGGWDQDGSGCQPGGGDQPSGERGQFGGGLNLIDCPLGIKKHRSQLVREPCWQCVKGQLQRLPC